jgi:hypothetical protein
VHTRRNDEECSTRSHTASTSPSRLWPESRAASPPLPPSRPTWPSCSPARHRRRSRCSSPQSSSSSHPSSSSSSSSSHPSSLLLSPLRRWRCCCLGRRPRSRSNRESPRHQKSSRSLQHSRVAYPVSMSCTAPKPSKTGVHKLTLDGGGNEGLCCDRACCELRGIKPGM